MSWVLAVIAIVAVAAVVAYFFTGRHSERAASHRVDDRVGSEELYGDNQAPAGPESEGQRVVGPGETAPGP